MQFALYRSPDGKILAVPAVFVPGEFVESGVTPERIAEVRIPPEQVSHDVIVAIGLHGYAELEGVDLAQFMDAVAASAPNSPPPQHE
jgi:hypothetical protein